MRAPLAGDEAVTWGTPTARWIVLATVLGSGMAFLDATVVNVALPTIGTELDASVAGLQWILNGYTLTLASLILIGGSLGDRFGRRRVFLVGIVSFAVASLLCALAPTAQALAAVRALQGIGGALLTPGSLAILQASFAPGDRGRAVGAWSGLSGIAAAIGPFLGGWLIGVGSWRLIFLINVPLAVAVVAVAVRHVPETRDPTAVRSIDIAGRGADRCGPGWGELGPHSGRRAGRHRRGAGGRRGRHECTGRLRRRGAVWPSPDVAARNLPLVAVRRRQPRHVRRVRQPRHHVLLTRRPSPAGPRLHAPASGPRDAAGHRPDARPIRPGWPAGRPHWTAAADDRRASGHRRRARAAEPRAGGRHLPNDRAAGTARVRPRTGADRCPLNGHRACRCAPAARRRGLGREQRNFAGRWARRHRGDSWAHRSDRRRLSGSGHLRAWLSHRDADECRVRRARCGTRMVTHPQRGCRSRDRARPPSSIAAATARSTARRWPPNATPCRQHAPPLELTLSTSTPRL